MKYSKYLDSLESICQTGKSNQANTDLKKHVIFPELAGKLSEADQKNEKIGLKIKEVAQTLYSICADSPLLNKDDSSHILRPLFRQSQDSPDPSTIPLVLSGPLVRRAEPGAVTVWVALKSAEEITLSVFEDNNGTPGAKVLTGQQTALKLGKSLFITAITATPTAPDGKPLDYGKSYLYEMEFGTTQQSLTSLGLAAELAYPDCTLPSFMLPPEDLNKVHLIHSSCRNITSDSYDSLPALDNLLQAEWKKHRPQQLFLSGDQIYADEANEVLEHLYIQVGNTLVIGRDANGNFPGTEKMRRQEDGEAEVNPAELIPGERGHLNKLKEFLINNQYKSFIDLLKEHANITEYPREHPGPADTTDYIHDLCGFTPKSRFHLFSLADFFGLYLLNWSDVLWPAFFREEEVKNWAVKYSVDHKNEVPGNLISRLEEGMGQLGGIEKEFINRLNDPVKFPDQKAYVEAAYEVQRFRMVINNFLEMINLVIFAAEMGKVRRVLANIATYMIFDDHDVTDDWHMTREWVHRVYGKPMGRRVLQNALASYAVFQGWGNIPARFTGEQTGRKLLTALSTWVDHHFEDPASEAIIANALKIPDKTQVTKYRAIGAGDTFPEIFDKPLVWDFQINQPGYEVLVLDARTFRSFPGSLYGAANHLSDKALKAQLPAPGMLPPPFSDKPRELTLVISPCNVVTIPLFRNFLSVSGLPLAHYFTGYKGNRWEMAAYDPDQADSWEPGTRMFEKFLSHLAVRENGQQPATKRENKVVILSGDVHFSFAGRLAYWADKPFDSGQDKVHEMVIAHLTASGMKNEAGAWKKLKLDLLGYEYTDLGTTGTRLPAPEVIIGYDKAPAALDKAKQEEIVLRTRWFPNYKPAQILRQPLLLPSMKIHPEVKVPKPEWMYRMDFIRGTKEKEIENFNTLSHFHYARNQGASSEIIRRSSFASITLDWEGEGTLTKALDVTAEAFTSMLAIGKTFPRPPFYVLVDTEIMYVTATEVTPGNDLELHFKKVKRGKADTTAQAHAVDASVKIRRMVSQTNWLVSEMPLKENGTETLPPAEVRIPELTSSALTRFKVAMAADDPQYTKPTPNIL